MRIYELNFFDDVHEASVFINEYSQKGYVVDKLSAGDNGVVVLMKKDVIDLMEKKVRLIELQQEYDPYLSKDERDFVKEMKSNIDVLISKLKGKKWLKKLLLSHIKT